MLNSTEPTHKAVLDAPTVTEMLVIPVAGEDSMLLNLSGAHGPLFTRNIVILKDNSGHMGAGEVPGGERIRKTLEDARPLVVGRSIAKYNAVLNAIREQFAHRDAGGHALSVGASGGGEVRSAGKQRESGEAGRLKRDRGNWG